MPLSADEKHAKLKQERAFLTSLLETSLQGRFADLERLVEDYALRQSIPVETVVLQFKDGQGRTALHFACQSQVQSDKDIVAELLQSDWLPLACRRQLLRLPDAEGLTPLMLAAQGSDRVLSEQRIQVLLQAAKETETKSVSSARQYAEAKARSGATALHYAASAGATATSIRLLSDLAPATVSMFSQQGGTPLHWACAASRHDKDDAYIQEAISALLDSGADWNACNTTTFPPLAYALATNHASRAKFLLHQAQDRTIDTTKTLHYELPGQTTVYHMAADLNMVGVLALLLEQSSEASLLDKRNGRGLTARELAALEGHLGCVLLLSPADQQTEEQAQAYMQQVKMEHLKVSDSPRPADDAALLGKDVKSTAEPSATEVDAQQEALRLAETVVSDELKEQAAKHKAEGNALFVKKEYQAAVDCYSSAISADPTDATFYSNRSACHVHLQNPTSALHDAVLCRYLKPDWPKGAYRLAIARLELGRYEDAAVAAWEGLQMDQENDELKSLLQKCVKLGRKEHKASQR